MVGGVVISVGRNEVRVDIGGIAIGLVRGPELDPNAHLAVGDEVEATVFELENEFGELELSPKEPVAKRHGINLKKCSLREAWFRLKFWMRTKADYSCA